MMKPPANTERVREKSLSWFKYYGWMLGTLILMVLLSILHAPPAVSIAFMFLSLAVLCHLFKMRKLAIANIIASAAPFFILGVPLFFLLSFMGFLTAANYYKMIIFNNREYR